jgi:chromate transporter
MKNDNKDNIYLKLFTSTFYISAFTFGGGFVIVPLLKKKFVDDLKWIEEKEMINMTAIAQSSPGAIAVNASILIGYQIAGLLGALVSILGTILPPLIIISTISLFYTAFRDNIVINALLKGMQAGVAAVIIDVVLNMGNTVVKTKQILSILMMIAAFIATYNHVNVIYIILVCGVIGAISTIYRENKVKEKK